MKKTKLLFIGILLSLITFSCSSDSHDIDDEITQPTSLVGKWYLIDAKSDFYEVTLGDCDKKSYIQFSSDATYKRIDYDKVGNDCIVSSEDDYGTYVYNPNEKTIILTSIDKGSPSGNEIGSEIFFDVKINDNLLYFSWDESGDGVGDYKVTYKK